MIFSQNDEMMYFYFL